MFVERGAASRPKVAFYTLGCKVNQYDTEAVAGLFKSKGYDVAGFDEPADVYVINTCTVTGMGDRKSRQMIRRVSRLNPGAVVVAMGCYSQTSPGEVAGVPGVDIVVGTRDRHRIVDLVEEVRSSERNAESGPVLAVDGIFDVREFEELPVESFEERTRASVKIQEGCNEFCSYCKVPFARGRSRSRRPEHVYQEIERLASAGYKEVVLTGVHLGAYGRDLNGEWDLVSVIKLIHPIEGLERIRVSSIDPNEVSPELIAVFRDLPKVCAHVHLPLQSGDDEILRRMRRRYDTRRFEQVVDQLREAIPDVAITTDVMVGFPGESDDHFRRSARFIEKIEFSRLHVFKYSPREGTPAARYPDQVEESVKDARSDELIALGRRLSRRFHERFIGRELVVLFETWTDASGGILEGTTENYIKVSVPGDQSLQGQLSPVLLTSADDSGAFGVIPDN